MQGGWHSARARRRLALSACAAALAALTGVLRFWRHDAATEGVLISAIGTLVSVAALVADVLRGDADPAPAPAEEQRRRAADALAEAVREQWAAEARLRRLQDPEPIDVHWAPADRRLADHPENVRGIGRPADHPEDTPRNEQPGDRPQDTRRNGQPGRHPESTRRNTRSGGRPGNGSRARRSGDRDRDRDGGRARDGDGGRDGDGSRARDRDGGRDGDGSRARDRDGGRDGDGSRARDRDGGRARRVPGPRVSRVEGLAEVFAVVPGRRLVVLGGPGAGKSVLAVRFVLARLAERQPGEPVPVIFPLAGWDPRRTGLREWLAERLAAEHRPLAAVTDGTRTLARGLLDAGLVLPVLDGFDELARPSYGEAVRRINAGLDDDLPLLLTSRATAWATAVAEGDVLTAAEVVELRPLDLAQATAHLERTARPQRTTDGTDATVWTPVVEELARHPHSPAATALTTPLTVSLARAVYGDTSRDPSELLDTARFGTAAAVEQHLLGAFVPAAYADAEPHTASDAARHLALLARELHRRDTGRLAWWELESLLPRALRVYAPGLLSMAVLSALLLPVAVTRAVRELAGVEDLLSLVATLVGQASGFAFGVAWLLPDGGGEPGRPFLVRQGLTVVGVSGALWAAFAYADDLRFGFRFGSVTDGWLPDLLGGRLFSLLFTLFFGIAGLPRRPVPLGLPWSGTGERIWARLCGAALLLAGAGTTAGAVLGRPGGPWPVLVGVTATAAGTALLVSGVRRAGREGALVPRGGRVVRRFATGVVRGTAVALLTGVTACTLAGLAATGVTVLKSGAAPDLAGRQVDGWRFTEHAGVRTAALERPLRGTLLVPGDGARPIAYPRGAVPPDCTVPLLHGRHCAEFRAADTVFESRGGTVVVRLAPGGTGGPVAYAADLRSVLPPDARAWLTQGPASGLLARCLPPFVVAGVVVGVVGGCVCGVYRALSVPSDTMRAPGPGSDLRTDRTASVTRGGVVALVVACVCVPVTLVPGDWGGLVHVGTQLWLPLGTAAVALSAWGRLAVARGWLAVTGRLPWRLMAFLEDAHRRGVLRQSGAYFEFRHLRLQSYLANETADAAPEVFPVGPPGPREAADGPVRERGGRPG
ncbi:NACHT domain-containing protein [Streptomyces sp. NPDC090088]|uniref:NACHT domain-containing protein n=1 Tax=Streptomyces sp. NPDC090088 TaxID=3365944 RepID=UPI0037F87F6B